MFPKRNYFLLLIILFLGSLVYFFLIKNQVRCEKICLRMQNLDQFTVKEVYQDNHQTYRALLSGNNDFLRVDIKSKVPGSEAQNRINAEVTRMKALFQNASSPYPGEISDEIECGQEFKPVLETKAQNNIQITYFTGYLNSRFTFGACTQDQTIYKGILAFFYCPKQRQLFQLEIIAPKEQFLIQPTRYQEMLSSLKCKLN